MAKHRRNKGVNGVLARSREDYLRLLRQANKDVLDDLRRQGRFQMIEYVYELSPSGYGKGVPLGVFISYEDDRGGLQYGWSVRNTARDEGLIVYTKGRYAGKSVPFSREIERKSFCKAEALFRAFSRSNPYCGTADIAGLPRYLVGDFDDFCERAQNRADEYRAKRNEKALSRVEAS